MRKITKIILLGAALAGAGCQTYPAAVPISPASTQADRVSESLAHWPRVAKGAEGIKRPFFATIHAAGKRVTASGILDYYSPRDFRVTAATEMGVILFDGRVNWAGVTVLRQMPGLDKAIVETLLSDMSEAFEVPASLDGVRAGKGEVVLRKKLADTHQYTWIFSEATGQLRQTDVDLGTFDTLHANFLAYDARGWPEEVNLVRRARLYDITMSFTDSAVAQGTLRSNQR